VLFRFSELDVAKVMLKATRQTQALFEFDESFL
jgi:hypothetical protein